MYDAPFDLLTRIGWSLAGLVVVLFVVRAVRVERAHHIGASGVARAAVAWDVVTGLVVLALVVDLLLLVDTVLG